MKRNHNESLPAAIVLFGGIFAVCFGIFWTVTALSMAPFMAIFGVFWTVMAVLITINNYKNAKKHPDQNNSIEEYPINTEREKSEPKEIRCPYCGAPVASERKECEYCGSKF